MAQNYTLVGNIKGPPGPPGSSGSVSLIQDETPAGTIDTVNHIFTTAHPFAPGSTCLYVNGLRQTPVSSYTESGPTTLDLSFAPHPGDVLLVDYKMA